MVDLKTSRITLAIGCQSHFYYQIESFRQPHCIEHKSSLNMNI